MAINLPIKKKEIAKGKISTAKRGMDFEKMINDSNEFYLNNHFANIHKKPTPVTIVKVDYPMRSKAVITEAYYQIPSTTDYNGIFLGKYIDFEAKETNSLTSFSLKNIHPHQVTHLNDITSHGGIGFLLVYFKRLDEVYLLPMDILNKYWINCENEEGRKSIPYLEFQKNCFLVKENYAPRLDYLAVVKNVYF